MLCDTKCTMQVGVKAGLQAAEARSPTRQQLILLQQQSSHQMNLAMLKAKKHCCKLPALPMQAVMKRTCWSCCLLLQGWQRRSSSSSSACLLMLHQSSGIHQSYLLLPCQAFHPPQASGCTCSLAKPSRFTTDGHAQKSPETFKGKIVYLWLLSATSPLEADCCCCPWFCTCCCSY